MIAFHNCKLYVFINYNPQINQFSSPETHSYKRLITKKKKNTHTIKEEYLNLVSLRLKIKGKIKINSTSNTKNTIVIKKKFNENGSRRLLSKSKPHSNTEDFSRSFFNKEDKNTLINMSAKISAKEINKNEIIIKMHFI